MDENSVPNWVIYAALFSYLVVPAVIAHFHGRSWFRWFLIGLILPIISFIILAILPRPKDQYDKQKVSEPSTNLGEKKPPPVSTNSNEIRALTLLDLTRQPVGSAEFKLEVASSYAESKSSLREFALKYNIDPNALKAWVDDFLGENAVDIEVSEQASVGGDDTLTNYNVDPNAQEIVEKSEEKLSTYMPNEERSVSISDGLTNLSSIWFDANKSIENKIEGDFSMSIKSFQIEGPDEDDEISMEIEFKLENASDAEIALIKKNLVLEQTRVGAIAGEVNDREECLLDPGEALEVTTWTRINIDSLDKSDDSVNVKFFASFYSSEFFKFTEAEIPAEANNTTSLVEDVDSDFFDGNIKIAIKRNKQLPYDEDEDDPEEDNLEMTVSLENGANVYIEDIEVNAVLIARNGSEIEETSDQLDVLAPYSGALLQPSFWNIKRSKLKDAKVNVSLKAYRLVGTQKVIETKSLKN